jgi:hypothetical protein
MKTIVEATSRFRFPYPLQRAGTGSSTSVSAVGPSTPVFLAFLAFLAFLTFLPSHSHSLVRPLRSFLRPGRSIPTPTRAVAVKDGRHTGHDAGSVLRGHSLTAARTTARSGERAKSFTRFRPCASRTLKIHARKPIKERDRAYDGSSGGSRPARVSLHSIVCRAVQVADFAPRFPLAGRSSANRPRGHARRCGYTVRLLAPSDQVPPKRAIPY